MYQRKRYWITRLPRYLILHLSRFTKNFYFTEKNPTIVTPPVKNLEMRDCKSHPSAPVLMCALSDGVRCQTSSRRSPSPLTRRLRK
jgi:hypothetical protein